jgi:hypothetical protein
MEMPYYHGPVYDELDRALSPAGIFDRLVMSGHLFIPDPLDDEVFARDMAGRPAILRAEGRRGRAVLFSADPEMGDLIRKYIAFDGYIARYLPVRGEAVMADTLRHYRVLDSPSFRLILNAVHSLMLRSRPPAGSPTPPVPRSQEPEAGLVAALDQALAQLPVADDDPRLGLIAMLRSDMRARLDRAPTRLAEAQAALASLTGPAPAIRHLWGECERAAAAVLAAPRLSHATAVPRSLADGFAEIETGLVLIEAWCRLAEAEAHFGVRAS